MEPFRFLHGVPLACASLLIGAWPAPAQDCLPVRARNPEGNYIVPGVQGEIVYRRVDGAELVLDAYVQRRGGLRPAVLVVHGGGWTSGSRVAFVGQLLETLTRAGFNWFSLEYRLGGLSRYADALDDLRTALAFVRCHAAEFRIDPQRVALLGEDAGAHLAALLAAEKPAGLRAAVLVGGFYDLSEAPPLRAVSAGMPDLLAIHGAADAEVPPEQAFRFCDAARAARNDDLGDAVNYRSVAKAALDFASSSRFFLVETLAERLAAHLMQTCGLPWVRLRVSKPGAVRSSREVGVEIERGTRP